MFFAYGETELACLRAKDKRLREVIDKIGHVDRVVDTDLFSAVVMLMLRELMCWRTETVSHDLSVRRISLPHLTR